VFRLPYHEKSQWENETAKLREVLTQMFGKSCFIPLKPKKLVYACSSKAASSDGDPEAEAHTSTLGKRAPPHTTAHELRH
jgi:hypothetical protein